MKLPQGIEGECAPAFAGVSDVIAEQVASGAHHGVQVAVRHRGNPVVDIWAGGFERDTLALSFSTTKGVTTGCVHLALERAGIAYDTPVVDLWPAFAPPGSVKARTTIRHVLCHEAGIPQIRDEVTGWGELIEWPSAIAVMERLEPLWDPGTANGYHAVNFGYLAGEILRLVDPAARSVGTFLAEEIAGPLGLDGAYIGTPESVRDRVAPLIAIESKPGAPTLEDMVGKDHLLLRALNPEPGREDFFNTAEALAAEIPAANGTFTARSLAKYYDSLESILAPETLTAATTIQNTRPDLVLFVPMHWRLGWMGGGGSMSPCGPNKSAFGHAGLGGSLAFRDPSSDISFAITLDKLQADLLTGDRVRRCVDAALAGAEAAAA